MPSGEPIRVFIGSGEASRLERKVAIYSLKKHTRRPLEIFVFNGTHNSLEREGYEPEPAGMSLKAKYLNVTEFSLYRFLIPEICEHRGRAIWIDSDTVCLSDIGELFDTPLLGKNFLAKNEAYAGPDPKWGLSVMLIDCEKTRFDLDLAVSEMQAGKYSYADFAGMGQKFLAHHPYAIGPLDPAWNSFDYAGPGTKLIHYTNLYEQPWKYPNHPYGKIWYQYLREAMREGYVTNEDIELSLVRSYVRRDVLAGNFTRFGRLSSGLKVAARQLKKQLRDWRAGKRSPA